MVSGTRTEGLTGDRRSAGSSLRQPDGEIIRDRFGEFFFFDDVRHPGGESFPAVEGRIANQNERDVRLVQPECANQFRPDGMRQLLRDDHEVGPGDLEDSLRCFVVGRLGDPCVRAMADDGVADQSSRVRTITGDDAMNNPWIHRSAVARTLDVRIARMFPGKFDLWRVQPVRNQRAASLSKVLTISVNWPA